MDMLAELLPQSPAWLADIAQTVPVGIVVIGGQGTIVWCNAELLQQFRYAATELVGQPLDLLLPERFRQDHAAFRRDYAKAPAARAMGSGREIFGRRSDEFEFPVEIRLRPLKTSTGVVFVATVIDISARRQAEATFRRVIEAAPWGMLMMDSSRRILLANDHLLRLFGYQRQELIAQTLDQLIPARHRAAHGMHATKYLGNATERAMGPGLELTGLRQDGSEFPVEIGLSPVSMESGACVLATVVDVTARRLSENRLKRANADLEEFAHVAAHDLRSPLRGIRELLTWIEQDLEQPVAGAVLNNLERMRIRVTRMDTLVESLLKYAHAGVADSEAETVDVVNWLNDEIELVNAPASASFQIHTEIPRIKVSKTPLGIVIRNLISNAIKHNDKASGVVEIDVRPAGAFVHIEVRDSGPGIPEASKERIFKLFQRLSNTTEGDGIGLALVKRIVEVNGGTISVSGRADGASGAVFLVAWPPAA